MDDVYENINDYNPIRKRKKLIVFDNIIADIMNNKNFQAIIKELFIRCRKLNISIAFITQSYFSVPKDIRLNFAWFDFENKEQKRITKYCNWSFCRHYYKDFMKMYVEYTKEPYYFLTLDTTLPAGNPLRFSKKLFDSYKNDSNWSD